MLLHIIPELLPTNFHFNIKSRFQNHPYIFYKKKLQKTVLGKSDTKMVFSKGLSKNVFNCHPRNKTYAGALARDYNWQFKVTTVNLVTTAIPNREALPGFPVA